MTRGLAWGWWEDSGGIVRRLAGGATKMVSFRQGGQDEWKWRVPFFLSSLWRAAWVGFWLGKTLFRCDAVPDKGRGPGVFFLVPCCVSWSGSLEDDTTTGGRRDWS